MTAPYYKKISCFLAVIMLLVSSPDVYSATISIINGDGAGEGFNDTTPAVPVPGNSGITLGQQRLNVFKVAADYWGNLLSSSVEIQVEASMDPLFCDATSAILGAAGPNHGEADFPNAPRSNTIYPVALANSLAGQDLEPASADIGATFNSSIDNNNSCLSNHNWWYGVGGITPSNATSLYDTVLHELAHGLGFLTFVDSNGLKFFGLDDHFMQFLVDDASGNSWVTMTNAERYASSRNGSLVWWGSNVVNSSSILASGKTLMGHVKLFAPSPYQPGSSVSHWDTSLIPDELMEPFATLTSSDTLTKAAFKDMGWVIGSSPPSGNVILTPVYHLLLSGYPEIQPFVQVNDSVKLDEWKYYQVLLSETATHINVNLFNLTDDADLYIRGGSVPTFTENDCASFFGGTISENCINVSTGGERVWYIGVHGYMAADFTLFVTQSPP